jgi:O-antigen ligase
MSRRAEAVPIEHKAGAHTITRKSTQTPRAFGILRGLAFATIALIAWLPFPIGGHAEWAAALAAFLTGLLLVVWYFAAWRHSLSVNLPFVFWPASLLVGGAVCWSILQVTPGVLPTAWNHPLWTDAIHYGLDAEGVISLDRSASIDAVLRFLATAGMFLLAFVLGQHEALARQLLIALLAIVTAYAAFGLTQELTGWHLSGSSFHRNNVVSTFVNRNHFATYANLGFLIALGMVIDPFLRGASSKERSLGTRVAQSIATILKERRYPLMAAVIILLAVIGSASRGGILSLLGAGFFLLLMMFMISRASRTTKFAVSMSILAVGGMIVWLTGGMLIARFRTIFAADALGYIDARIGAWAMTLEAIRERPLLGYGHGAYQELFFLYHGPEVDRAGIFDHAHNDYLQLAAELGLPAAGAMLLALMLLWGLCLKGALTRRRRWLYPLVASGAGVLVALHAVIDFSLLMPSVAMTFAAILGIGCAQSSPRGGEVLSAC